MSIKVLLICLGIIPSIALSQQIVTKDQLGKTINNISKEQAENSLSEIVKKYSDAVVLIHTISNIAEDDGLIYNSSLKKRLKKHHYKHGVISGVLLSEDGVICTTANGVMNSDEIIVSVKSELKPISDTSKIELGQYDYKAKVIKIIPDLNLAFLKITPHKKEVFSYIKLGNDTALINKKGVLLNSSVVIGKAKGEDFVTQAKPANSKNNFSMIASGIEKLSYSKELGSPVLVIDNSLTNTAVFPENEGGAVIDNRGELLGIAYFNNEDFSMNNSLAIPVSVIKQALKIAVPNILFIPETYVGIKIKEVNKTIPENLKKILHMKQNDNNFVKIDSVELNSAADKAGLKPQDIILKFNNDFVKSIKIYKNLEKASWGEQTINLKILRDNKLLDFEINR